MNMDKLQLYLFSLKIKEQINSLCVSKAEKMLLQAELSQEEIDFVNQCLLSYSYDPITDSFSITHSDNSEFLKLVASVITNTQNKRKEIYIMNKKQLYLFSLEVRKLLNNQNTDEAVKMLLQANLSQEEVDFVEKCLLSDGYDLATDSFMLLESDNSEFLKLVNIMISKTTKKK